MGDERQHGDRGPCATTPAPRPRHRPAESNDRAAKRECLLETFVEVVAREGYRQARVEDVCRDVGVSVREFYDRFESKERCYLTAFNAYGQHLAADAERAYQEVGGPWEAQMRAALECVTEDLVARPRMVRFLLEFHNVKGGRTALSRLVARAGRVYFTEEVRRCAPPAPGEALESIVSGMVVQPMLRYAEEGKLDRLHELVPWIVYHVTLNLFGPERAARQYPESA